MFKFLRQRKEERSLASLIAEYAKYKQMTGQLARAESLVQLGRHDEAESLFAQLASQLGGQRTDKTASMLLTLVYITAQRSSEALRELDSLLARGDISLTEDERIVLEGERLKLRRRNADISGNDDGFTDIYNCQFCGRLVNFVSLPCPHCSQFPKTEWEMACSLSLSAKQLKFSGMLVLAREAAAGRQPTEIVANIRETAAQWLEPSNVGSVRKLLGLATDAGKKPFRTFGSLRRCAHCGGSIVVSDSQECPSCGQEVQWPPAIRAIICLDNLVWLFENRLDPGHGDRFLGLVRILIGMSTELLRKQIVPSSEVRRQAIAEMVAAGSVFDSNGGAVIDTKNPNELKIYLVKSNQLDDSESFGLYWYHEIEEFVRFMQNSIPA